MAKEYLDKTGLAHFWEKLKSYFIPKVLDTKEYSGIIGSANDAAGATFYFANIIPDDYYKQWKVHYRVTASVPGQNAYNQVSEVTLIGDQNAQRSYRGENSNTGTRSYLYNALYRATLAGCNNGYGHALGVGLRGSTNPTSTSYLRTFTIELLDYEGCTVTLWDEMKKYASIPGTGSTNYAGLTESDGYTNGYKQTGDNNQIERLQTPTFAPKAGAGGLKQYGLFMEDGDGAYQSLTTTNGAGTSKTKNTAGFIPGKLWYFYSGSNIASGASGNAGSAYTVMPIDIRYSINANVVAHEPLYLVGTIGNDGLFYLDDTWWTQSLPTTNDGKLYMYVGLAYSTTNVHLAPDHPMYWYKNGAVRLWPDGMDGASSAVSGVKGNAETTYRTGDVNLTPANIGAAQAISGMAADGSAPSVASGTTFVDLETGIAIAANHRYLCNYIVQWTSNATGRRAIKAVMGTTDVGIISQNTCAPANGAATIHGASFWIQPSSSARTMKIQGYQNSGSALTATVRYQLIDFGTA